MNGTFSKRATELLKDEGQAEMLMDILLYPEKASQYKIEITDSKVTISKVNPDTVADKFKKISEHIISRKEHLKPLFEVTMKMLNKAIVDKDEIAKNICSADRRIMEAHFFELNEIQNILNK